MGASGVEFLAVNTDANCLEKCLSVEKLMLGEKLTRGLGAGARPEIGEMAALESREEIRSCLKGCDMVYLAAGMGGGTGTGALPVIAEIAKDMEILTVSVVTRPFSFEGKKRKAFADQGIDKLKKVVDALIIVPNDRLLHLSERTTSLADAFSMADDVLRQAVQGVTDLVTKPGQVNVDFADLRSIMKHAGGAVMGIGRGSGEHRAEDALKRAMECPLMASSVHGAKGVILNVTASSDIGIIEVQDASAKLQSLVDPDATFIWGMAYDEEMGDEIQMVVIATGFQMDPEGSSRSDDVKALKKQDASPPAESLFDIDSVIDTPSYLRKKNGL
jgi:cell division protein FtsZ